MWSKSRENGYERSSNVGGDSSCSYQSLSTEDDDSENESVNKSMGIEPRNNSKSGNPNRRPGGKLGNNTSSAESFDFHVRKKRPSPKSALQVYTSNHERIKRKRSDDEDEFQLSDFKTSGRGQKCHSRNAIMARQNRIKKKMHLQSLENSVSKLTEENEKLQVTLDNQTVGVSSLKDRVRYLEGVLANSRELGMLLNSVKNSTGLPTINSLRRNTGKPQALGFPPPQPDHIYSRTPDVLLNCSISPCGEDNLTFVPNSLLVEDSVGPLIADDVSISYASLAEENSTFPKSDNSIDLDFNEFNHPFDFEGLEDDALMGDVGICLHIAKKRVSLEFCSSCNNNSATSWDNNILAP